MDAASAGPPDRHPTRPRHRAAAVPPRPAGDVQIILGLAIYNSDLLFLRLLQSSEDVGYYAAAYALIGFLNNVSVAYGLSVLPTLSRLPDGSAEQRELYRSALLRAFVATLPVVVGGVLVAPSLMVTVYGDQYAPSGGLLQILLLSIPFSTARVASFCALIPIRAGSASCEPRPSRHSATPS